MEQDKLSRRDVLKRAGVAGVILGSGGVLASVADAHTFRGAHRAIPQRKTSGSVEFFTYAVYSDPKLTKAFTQQSGLSIKPDNFGELDEMLSKVRATRGKGFDTISVASNLVGQMASEGLIQPIDTTRLKNWKHVYPSFKNADFVHYKGKLYGVPTVWGPEGLIYRTDKIKSVDSWDILWDEKYSKQMSVIDYDYEMILIAALKLGMKKQLAKNPITFSKGDLAKIKAALQDQIKLDSKLWSDASVAESLLASGESAVTVGRVLFLTDLRKKNVPVKLVNPKEGTQGWVTSTVLSAGSSNVDNAYKFLDYVISPSYGLPLGMNFGYPLTSSQIMAKIPAAKRKDMVLQDPNLVDKMIFWKPAAGMAEWTKIWSEVKAGA
jgi:spermidine/putrescine transport system substrate-binding protein